MLAPLRISLVLLVLCGGIYPAVVTAIGHTLFPYQAEGSIVQGANGQDVGSALIAQDFDKDQYFHPRPSAAGVDGYDATSSGGSNLGPTNAQLITNVTTAANELKEENPALTTIPADLVTMSASGLDPDLSPEGALAQVPLVAKARGLTVQQVTDLVNSHIVGPDLGILGAPRVNVLLLNLDLDKLKK